MKGLTQNNPILCSGVKGEQDYIEKQKCPNGKNYMYKRVRAIPIFSGEKIKMIDEYKLNCMCGKHVLILYFDMYH